MQDFGKAPNACQLRFRLANLLTAGIHLMVCRFLSQALFQIYRILLKLALITANNQRIPKTRHRATRGLHFLSRASDPQHPCLPGWQTSPHRPYISTHICSDCVLKSPPIYTTLSTNLHQARNRSTIIPMGHRCDLNLPWLSINENCLLNIILR